MARIRYDESECHLKLFKYYVADTSKPSLVTGEQGTDIGIGYCFLVYFSFLLKKCNLHNIGRWLENGK